MLNYLLSKSRMKRMLSVFIIVSMLFTSHASFVFAEGTVGANSISEEETVGENSVSEEEIVEANYVSSEEETVGASLRALDEDDEEVSMDSHDFDMKI